ncbi:hypothetical protein Tco_0445456, partial [Tanacetum coccineum]
HNDVPVVPEPVLEDKDEDPGEEEFKEEKDPQEEEDDMEVDIEEYENEPELTYPYEEVDPLNPPPPAYECEPDNEIEVENPIEHEDETVPISVYEVGKSSTAAIPREDGDRLLHGFMRRDIDSLFGRMVNFSRRLCGRETAYALVEKKSEAKDKFYGKLILDLGNEVRSSVNQGTAAMERLVEKLGNVKEKAECKKLKKELKEAKLSNTFLQMIRKGFVFEERPKEAIDVPIEDIIKVNKIPLNHVDDVPVVEPNQHDDDPVVPEPILEDEDEDPEDEFEEEEDPQEDEDDMEIDIEEDKNEPELTYPYEELDPLNPLPPASESEPDNEIEVENPIEHEDGTIPVSVYEVGKSSTAAIPREDGDRLLPGFMRWDIDSLFGRMVNFSR